MTQVFVRYFCVQYIEIKWNENRDKEEKKRMNHAHTLFNRIEYIGLSFWSQKWKQNKKANLDKQVFNLHRK